MKPARVIKEMLIILFAIGALLYLLFPSIVPDFIPLIGWVDEGAATVVLLNTLNYYGLDLTNLYGKPAKKRRVRRYIVPTQQQDNSQSVNQD